MNGAFLSLIGLYALNDKLFDGLQLPSQIKRDDFIDELMMQTAELEVIYTDSQFMAEAIRRWSSIRLDTWERIAFTLYNKYDPYINMRRDEHRTNTQTRDLTGVNSSTAWDTDALTDRNQSTDTGTISYEEHFHSEGDSALYVPSDILVKETEARMKYDLYNYIIDDFKKRFCLLIY